MSAKRLGHTLATLGKYDVVGMYTSGTTTDFVRHVGLADEATSRVSATTTVSVTHMEPPFKSGRSIPCHCVGSAGLTDDDINRLEIFIDNVSGEFEAQNRRGLEQYVVVPHVKPVVEKGDGTLLYRRFNCAGFVVVAYQSIDLDFVVVEESNLPPIDNASLEAAYPKLRKLPMDQREDLGLVGKGPWPILMPGYILHALNREVVAIRNDPPYTPKPGDENFL